MTETKQTSTTKTDRRPDCVTEIRMGNSVLTVSGFFYNEAKLQTVKVDNYPRTEYAIGETFDAKGLDIIATFGGVDRKIIAKGMGYFIPMRYSELPRFYRENLDPVDVVMLQTTPMDAHGNFNFGVACSHIADILARAKCIIVEVNTNMPWVNGLSGSEINIRDVDMVVEGENPELAQLGAGAECLGAGFSV